MEFGLWLRNNRNKEGISTRQLAAVCDVSPSYISQVERGHIQKPSLEVARKIMAALSIENAEEVLIRYGYIEAGETYVDLVEYESERSQLIEHLRREIDRMDFEQLEAINLFYRYQDMFMKISKIDKASSDKNTKIPIRAIGEFVDFLHYKYASKSQSKSLNENDDVIKRKNDDEKQSDLKIQYYEIPKVIMNTLSVDSKKNN